MDEGRKADIRAGREARAAGKKPTDNPYEGRQAGSDWASGYGIEDDVRRILLSTYSIERNRPPPDVLKAMAKKIDEHRDATSYIQAEAAFEAMIEVFEKRANTRN